MHQQAWIDFTDLGHDGYLPIAQYEMQLLLTGAEQMIEEHDAEACAQMMDRLATDLWLDATLDKITRKWITKATMLIAMRGLMGEKIPDIRHSPD
jgi:hypothetical protein